MAGPVDWPVSAPSISDWVTPFRISPKICTKMSLVGSSLSCWIGSAVVPLCRHLVSAVGRSASYEVEMYLLVPLCRHLISAVSRNASHEVEMYFLPPCFRQILTICCYFYRFFRERDIASGRSPDRDQADPFYAPTRSARWYDFAPDIQDAM